MLNINLMIYWVAHIKVWPNFIITQKIHNSFSYFVKKYILNGKVSKIAISLSTFQINKVKPSKKLKIYLKVTLKWSKYQKNFLVFQNNRFRKNLAFWPNKSSNASHTWILKYKYFLFLYKESFSITNQLAVHKKMVRKI